MAENPTPTAGASTPVAIPTADLNISIRRANGSTVNASAQVADSTISGIFDQVAGLIVNSHNQPTV